MSSSNGSAFQSRHYRKVAEVLADAYCAIDLEAADKKLLHAQSPTAITLAVVRREISENAIDQVRERFISMFGRDNPNFDVTAFSLYIADRRNTSYE